VQLLAPIALQVLNEMNMNLLRDTGQITESGLRRIPDGGLKASWALSWPEQRAAGVGPIELHPKPMPLLPPVTTATVAGDFAQGGSLWIRQPEPGRQAGLQDAVLGR